MTKFVEWSDVLSVGIEEIDAQHKVLVGRILGYPEYEEHKAQHESLIAAVQDLQEKVDSGKASVGFELMHFLKVWLTKHIIGSHCSLAEHLPAMLSSPRPRAVGFLIPYQPPLGRVAYTLPFMRETR